MITFYLVQHGEAENNVRGILNSLPEGTSYSLTGNGRLQVEKTAEYLASVKPDVIISSPIVRTRETAEIISAATHLPVLFDERLCETGMGLFNGKSHEELIKKYPQPSMRIRPDEADGLESYITMRGRLQNFLHDVEQKYDGKKVVVVSHGDPLEQFHGILTHESLGLSATGWYPKKGACTEVTWKV